MQAKKVVWQIESTEEFDDWLEQQDASDQDHIVAMLRHLEREGPSLGRPSVDTINGSKHPNMKELRPGSMRILFAFDPRRSAILLLGGDKTNRWSVWYVENIPRADALYDRHLEQLARQAGTSPGVERRTRRGKRR